MTSQERQKAIVTVSVSSELPIPAEMVAGLVAKPALMRHVLWPLITFLDLPDHYDREGETTVRLRALGVIPLWRHTVRVVHADPDAGVAITEERGGPLRLWRHRLSAVPIGENRCRYTDEVEIDAGVFTVPGRVVARVLYRHRHRRWAGLARVLAQ